MEPNDKSLDPESVRRRTALFYKFVWPHRNLIYSLCIRYTYCQEDIADNYNEVLVNFFKYMDTYDPQRSIQTWLHIVTKRFVADLNHRNSQFKRSDDIDVQQISGNLLCEDGPPASVMGLDNYRELYSDDILLALDSLRPIYREALLLQQAGYKLGEIMEITFRRGSLRVRNFETVKSRLFLAKQQMRKIITRDGDKREE